MLDMLHALSRSDIPLRFAAAITVMRRYQTVFRDGLAAVLSAIVISSLPAPMTFLVGYRALVLRRDFADAP
jgi:hypothetical protein